MKILFIVQNSIGRGTYLRAFELARGLKKLGNEMTILSSLPNQLKKTAIFNSDGIRIIASSNLFPGPFQSGWDLLNLWARKLIIKKFEFDLVHGFETRPTVIYPALSLRNRGIPLYLDWADWFGKGGSVEERPNPILRTLLRPIETYFENHFRKHPLGTTVICETLKERALDSGVTEKQLCLLYNGFNVPGWVPISIETARTDCNLDLDTKLIGYLGSLFPRDAKLMADSFNAVESLRQNVRLIHIGASNYQTKKYIKNPSALIETGPVDFAKMMTYISACDFLWLPFQNSPANQGRFPLKFTNYIASGRPVIATDVGDVPKFIRKYDIGKVCEVTHLSICEASLSLLDNPESCSKFGENALKLSKDPSQNWSQRAENLYSFYQKG
jgi:glycosyltransferase involved in cell wall biosynthesis